MSVIELKLEMATAILNDIDEVRLSKLSESYKKLYKTRLSEPCIYSIEELKESLIEVVKDFEGGKGIPHNVVMAEYGL